MHADSPLARMLDAATLKRWQITVDRDEPPAPAPANDSVAKSRMISGPAVRRKFTAIVHGVDRASAFAALCDAINYRRGPKTATIELLA